MRVLLLRFDAPLMAFGGEMVDVTGPTRADPDVSLLAGLFANALGYRRQEAGRLQRLQDRLIHAVRLDREGETLIDFQTARLAANDKGWTTRGLPEGRGGGAGSYEAPHLRSRHYRADALVTIAASLAEPDETPTVADLWEALEEPARPLFIGRKPCLPSAPLGLALIEAESLVAALDTMPAAGPTRHVLPPGEADSLPGEAREIVRRTTRRDYLAGVHTGQETRVILTRIGSEA